VNRNGADHEVEFSIPMNTAVHHAICETTALEMNLKRAFRGRAPKRIFGGNRPKYVVHRVIATPLSESTSTAPSFTSVTGLSRFG
jgi:hypothetical protein